MSTKKNKKPTAQLLPSADTLCVSLDTPLDKEISSSFMFITFLKSHLIGTTLKQDQHLIIPFFGKTLKIQVSATPIEELIFTVDDNTVLSLKSISDQETVFAELANQFKTKIELSSVVGLKEEFKSIINLLDISFSEDQTFFSKVLL